MDALTAYLEKLYWGALAAMIGIPLLVVMVLSLSARVRARFDQLEQAVAELRDELAP